MNAEETIRLARARTAAGGLTLLPIGDVAAITGVPVDGLRRWVQVARLHLYRPLSPVGPDRLDLGEVVAVRDQSRVRPPGCPLTYRGLTTLRLYANGYTSAEVSAIQGRGVGALDSSVHEMCRILRARNRWHLIAIALASGVLQKEDIETWENADTEPSGNVGNVSG